MQRTNEVETTLREARTCDASGDLTRAESLYRNVLALEPRHIEAHANLAAVCFKLGRMEDALEGYDRAIELDPGSSGLLANRGTVLSRLGHFDEAVATCQRAISLDSSAENHVALANCYRGAARFADAIAAYERAIALAPDWAGCRMDYASALLLHGDFDRGWREFEWRWRVNGASPKRYAFQPWTGDLAEGKHLLLWGEQGLGDELIYSTLIPDLLRAGLRLTLETDPRLVGLMQRSFPEVRVVPRQDPPTLDASQFDWQCPLGSLGRWLRPSFDSFSSGAGYLRPDTARVARYATRLRGLEPRKVIGISWRSINREYGGAKSIPLSDWRTILRSPGACIVDLQYGDTRAERAALAQESVELLHFHEVDLYRDLEGMAALCAACDLIITASNVTAHFAGAIGKPTWLLAPAGRGRTWHWFSGRSDSPWYPSLRIFTPRTPGRWAEALGDAGTALRERS